MNISEAREEYKAALKIGQRDFKELTSKGANPYPVVLDSILPENGTLAVQELPLCEIPIERIIGVKSQGRIFAFNAGFMPLLEPESEFGTKWISLCAAHLSDVGITDPIECYEYLGDFYVTEGNKRISVMKYFGAASISARVKRILPSPSDKPRIKAYYEFLDFYKVSGLYTVKYTKPGDYAKLLAALGKDAGEVWSDMERRSFSAVFSRFREAFSSLSVKKNGLYAEDALLLWLEVYPYSKISEESSAELKKDIASLLDNVITEGSISVSAMPQEKKSIISSILNPARSHLNVAFVHQRDIAVSLWTLAHDRGSAYLSEALGDRVTVKSYFNADTPEDAEALIHRAVTEGAEVVFTTTPSLLRPTLKVAIKYPRVRFFNCSANVPFSSVRGYYVRAFEGKFITGAIAGAMSEGDRIGYIASYPILGVPASINAFALGAQMTNPNAKIDVRWSCLSGNHTEEFLRKGINVISNRDVPVLENKYLKYGEFGTFSVDADGTLTPLGSPCWLWGTFYEKVVKAILSGTIDSGKNTSDAVNYWLGMAGGVLDVTLSDMLPEGVRFLADHLREALKAGTLDPFDRRITAQDGTLKNDGSHSFSADELLHIDWLCDNIDGAIPEYADILPVSQATVRELGVHRENIPPEKEAHK